MPCPAALPHLAASTRPTPPTAAVFACAPQSATRPDSPLYARHRPRFPASTLGHSKSSVLLRFAIRDGNIWQCGNGDTLGRARRRAQLIAAVHRGSLEGAELYDSAATSCTARRISSGRFLALSFCLSCEQALTTVL